MNEALTLSRDVGGTTPGLAAASQSASGLSRFTMSTHSPSVESPFHSCASKLSSPSAMGVSGLSRVNSPSLARVTAHRLGHRFSTANFASFHDAVCEILRYYFVLLSSNTKYIPLPVGIVVFTDNILKYLTNLL